MWNPDSTRQLLASEETISALTHNATRDSHHSEVEVGLESGTHGRELVAKAVVDITAPEKINFDKAQLTKLVKNEEWPKLKVVKKAVVAH